MGGEVRVPKILYLDCFAGISGDMALSALVDLGVPVEVVLDAVGRVGIPGFRIEFDKVESSGISAVRTDVRLDRPRGRGRRAKGTADGRLLTVEDRTAAGVAAILRDAPLEARVRDMALSVFDVLAQAEGRVHGVPPDEVHFHEVGAWDSIADIVGTCAAIHHLGVDSVVASSPTLGTGFARTRHGTIPVPAPATLEILKGVPVNGTSLPFELTTPTGAALLKALATSFGPLPPGTVLATGYGAGRYDLPDRPDLLRAILLEPTDLKDSLHDSASASALGEIANPTSPGLRRTGRKSQTANSEWLIATNIDDSSPQLVGRAVRLLLDAGALDVWMTPIYMKKNRPGVQLSVLCRDEDRERLKLLIVTETSAIGLRETPVSRTKLEREIAVMRSSLGRVRVKIARVDGEVVNIAPEFDDIDRMATRKAMPGKQVLAIVTAEAWNRYRPKGL